MMSQSPFDGRLVLPSDPDWEEAVFARVFNGRRPARRPAAVLVAGSVEDVRRGVLLAEERGWTVAVRSGGHSLPVWSVREGGLLIDLGALNGMDYDEDSCVVSVGPATMSGYDLFPFLAERGRFFNGGHHPSVGVGGFLLQGGQGWAQRGLGWGAESVVAVDVVTADGELVRADAEENADLYWAARGAGPGFPGIVVGFHLRTRPLYGYLAHTVHLYEIDEFTEVMTWLYQVHGTLAPGVELVVEAFTAQIEGEEPRRRFVVSGLVFAADRHEATAALAPFGDCPVLPRAVSVQDCVETTMADQIALQEEANPAGAQYISDNIWADGDPDEIVARIRPIFADPPVPGSWAIWMSNAPLPSLPDMAFSLQSEALVNVYLVYDDPADYATNRRWLDGAMAHAQAVTIGQYIGESDQSHRQLRFIAPQNWERLQEIVARRDPRQRFAGHLTGSPTTLNTNHWERQSGCE